MVDTQRVQLGERAYQLLRRKIVLCELAPGAWVSEAELQEATKLPRTPTREATMRLVYEKMLVVYPRRGYRVADISEQSAIELFAVFLPLIQMAGDMAKGHINPRVGMEAKALISGREGSVTERLLDATDVLVPAILSAAANPWLTDTTMALFAHVERLWAFSYSGASTDDQVIKSFEWVIEDLDADPRDPELRVRTEQANDWIRQNTLKALRAHLEAQEREATVS